MMSTEPRSLSRSQQQLLQMILIALFAALSYVALTVFRIPYPAPVGNPFIHLGNMVTILAALLLGGWQGGLSGSIGMGMYDLFFYPDSVLKTLILKFGIGLFTGVVVRAGRRHAQRSPLIPLLTAAGVSVITGTVLMIGRFTGAAAFAKVPTVAYGFLLVLGIILLITALLPLWWKRVTREIQFAVLGATAGIAWNVAGEYAGGIITKLLMGSDWQAAMVASLMSLPATLINGSVSIVGAVALYIPLKAALHRARLDGLLAK